MRFGAANGGVHNEVVVDTHTRHRDIRFRLLRVIARDDHRVTGSTFLIWREGELDVEVSAGFGRSACRNHRGDNDLLSRRVAFEVEPRNRRVGRIEFNVRYAQRIGAEVVETILANELVADRDLRELFRYADGSKQRVAATEFQVNREPATQHAGGVDTREARSYVISPERELGGLRSHAG